MRTILIAVLTLTVGVAAQSTTVHPPGFDAVDASEASNVPWAVPSSTLAMRQYHYQEVRTLPGTTGILRGLAFRRDNYTHAGGASAAFWVDCEVAISTAATTPATISPQFALNQGKDRVVIVARKKLNFASVAFVTNAAAQPFSFRVPFDQGRLLSFKGPALCIDIKTFDNNVLDSSTNRFKNIYFDEAKASATTSNRNTGRGCYTSNTNVYLPVYGFSYATLDKAKNRWNAYGYSYNGLPGGTGLQIVSASALKAGVRLPGTLCYLYVDPSVVLWALAGSANSATNTTYFYPPYQGNARQYFYVPNLKELSGASLAVQYLALDPAANALGLAASPLNTWTFPRIDGLDMATIYDFGAGFTNATAAHGHAVSAARGNVMQISY